MMVMDIARQQAKKTEEVMTDERLERVFGPMLQNMLNAFQHLPLGEGEEDGTKAQE